MLTGKIIIGWLRIGYSNYILLYKKRTDGKLPGEFLLTRLRYLSMNGQGGLGWGGSDVIHCFISVIISDFEPDSYSSSESRNFCGTCNRCVKACPTGALSPYEVNANLCISYNTIERKDEIPPLIKEKMGNRFFGCDACQDACPWNRGAVLHHVEEFASNPWVMTMSREDWLDMDEDTFKERFADTPFTRPGLERIKRNI